MVKTSFYNTDDKKVNYFEELLLKDLIAYDNANGTDPENNDLLNSQVDWVRRLQSVSDADMFNYGKAYQTATPAAGKGYNVVQIVAEARQIARDAVKANLNAGFQQSDGINSTSEQAAIAHFYEYRFGVDSDSNRTIIEDFKESNINQTEINTLQNSVNQYVVAYGLNIAQTNTLKQLIDYAIDYGVKKDSNSLEGNIPFDSVFS